MAFSRVEVNRRIDGAPSLVRAICKEDSSAMRFDCRKKVARTKLGAPLGFRCQLTLIPPFAPNAKCSDSM